MKFAKCMYARFENSKLNIRLNKGDVFAVTPDIEESQFFVDGLNTRNFIIVEITKHAELVKVVNVTTAMKKEFTSKLAEADKARKEKENSNPEPKKPLTNPVPEDKGVKSDDETPVISFTELAGNQEKAIKAIENETDIEELKLALKLDERKKVGKALKERIAELEKKE